MKHLGTLMLCSALQLLAQGPEVAQWALQVRSAANIRFAEIPDKQHSTLWAFDRLKRLPDDQQTAQGKPRVLTGFAYLDAGRVGVEFGLRSAGAAPGDIGEAVGKYSLAPDETMMVNDLKKFGYEPIEIKVLPNQMPLPDGFQVNNKTTSLKVKSIIRTRSDLRIDVENISGQGVAVMAWSGGLGLTEGPAEPVMHVGATQRFTLGGFPADEAAASHYDVTILGISLEDGAMEGAINIIAPMEATRRGQRDQERRMITFVDQAVQGSDWRDIHELDKLCALLESLTVDDDRPLFHVWVEEHLDLASTLRTSYRAGRAQGRSALIQFIRQYDHAVAATKSFAEWWAPARDANYKLVLRAETAPAAAKK